MQLVQIPYRQQWSKIFGELKDGEGVEARSGFPLSVPISCFFALLSSLRSGAELFQRLWGCKDDHNIARLQDCFACDDLSVVVPYNRRQQATFGERKFSDSFADDGGRSS
jgi:hypothetical protein